MNVGSAIKGERGVGGELGNAGDYDALSRFAAPPLRSGPSGDTPQPPALWFAMAGSVLPAREGRMSEKKRRDIGGLTEVHIRNGGTLIIRRVPKAVLGDPAIDRHE